MKPPPALNRKPILFGIPIMLLAWSAGPAHAYQDAIAVAPEEQPRPRGPTDPTELEAFLDGVMTAHLNDKNVAGATVAVVRDGEIFFAKGYGYADWGRSTPVDPERTLFRIGSVSKLFTWTAVMQLAEQRKLHLQADVNSYIDFEIPEGYDEPITLTHLLTHTPGFEDRGFGLWASTADDIEPMGDWLAANIPARVRPPGVHAAYSNYGTALAGYIVERVSGVSWEEYLEQNIFEPLGMEYASARQPLSSDLTTHMSAGYAYTGGQFDEKDFEWGGSESI